jgi:hypothetical protein
MTLTRTEYIAAGFGMALVGIVMVLSAFTLDELLGTVDAAKELWNDDEMSLVDEP